MYPISVISTSSLSIDIPVFVRKKFIFQLFVWVCFLVVTNISAQTAQNTPTPSWLEEQRKATETFYKLDQSNNYTESLTYADMNILPIGIKKTVGNMEVTIAVSDMRLETTHSELTLFARIKIPQDDKLLFFGAQGIKLSHTGDIIGDASLVLMGDFSIPINGNTAALKLKGSFDKNTGRAKELTYVSVDCKGFREMGIAAEVEFPESMMSPIDSTGNKVNGRVKGAFATVIRDWNDLLVNISLPPFQINGLEGFIFTLGKAVFDMSDYRNDPSVAFPLNYKQNYLIPDNIALWRGVFVKDLSITLPKQFVKRGNKRVSFESNNLLIDNNGVSGSFAAAGILPINEGSASGWRFSVDAFGIELEANQLTSAGFSGAIGLPVSENSNLGYDAIITMENEYFLKVKSLDTVSFDVFHAKAQLLPNSYVELKVVDDKFKPEALLHGSLNIEARLDGSSSEDVSGKSIAQFKGIEFRSLRLKTDAPRFTAEYFGYKGELAMMNFPVSVKRIGLRTNGDEVGLGMDLKLTLGENLFTGSTSLEFVGDLTEKSIQGEEARQQWHYKKLILNSVEVNAKIAEVVTIKGGLLILNNDPVYGDGFSGNIQLTFDKVLKGLDVKARGMFGKKEFRYWFVDGLVALPGEGIPAFPPVNLKGFGGGISNRMKRDGADATSPTGAKYVPDSGTALGIKASVLFNVANDAAVNGEAAFEVAFNRSGGLNFIGFYGFAKFIGKIPGTENIEKFVGDKMKKIAEMEKEYLAKNPGMEDMLTKLKQYEPDKVPDKIFPATQKPGQDGFAAAMGIQYDFTQQSLHATFDLYVTTVGGFVRGAASGNRAGWAVLHIDPQDWYIHMGTPTDRLGLKMTIQNIVSVETGSYFMLGSQIPASPPPPKEVADILGVDLQQLDYMRDLNALGDGKGLAFGSSLRVATGDITFLILYANFAAGMGFDIMLKDYNDVQCKGRSGKIGFDGWYANGQGYAYLQGELGVKVNLTFIKAKVPIIKGAAAALIQAKLPNPSWFKGYLAVKFNVLGGLVSGSCKFKFTVGEECDLVIPGGSPLDMRMISDLSPRDNSKDVDVFAAPQATFVMKMGVPFEVEDDRGVKAYRIQLISFDVKDGSTSIPGKLVWTQNKDAVSFYSTEVLPPGKSLKAIVRVGFEEWQRGQWVTVYTAGLKAEELMEASFSTGIAPDVIPINNVEYSYPVVDQKFFLQGESRNAYVQLKRGQSYLFSQDFKHEVQFLLADGSKQSLGFIYDAASNRIKYNMPDLMSQKEYSFNLVTLNKDGSAIQNTPVAESVNVGNEDDIITVANKQASTLIRSDVGRVLLAYQFTTSRHNTLAEKIQSITKGSAAAGRLASDVIDLRYEISSGEPFDVTELVGTEFSGFKPTVNATAVLDDEYYKQDISPILYQNYPVAGIKLERDVNILGLPPIKAIPISTSYLTEVELNNFNGYARKWIPYIYNLPQIYKEDFIDLQHKIVNRFFDTPSQAQYNYIINGYYKFVRSGYYKVKFQYVMPDGTKGTEAYFDYYNFIK
ncbi:hypothetical protein [Chryseosolibacter indicus]|uniref:Uncharacterized protein n=1 Tax=Chryseosolibacter indicus TaxID=2782351 RepID=A0ABS5VW69_9BACT|nr:hypothetical protein [Chryseosolibacter indicus]MBT1705119.1 hypothetical protein [Chryseosolibacter indicus]